VLPTTKPCALAVTIGVAIAAPYVVDAVVGKARLRVYGKLRADVVGLRSNAAEGTADVTTIVGCVMGVVVVMDSLAASQAAAVVAVAEKVNVVDDGALHT